MDSKLLADRDFVAETFAGLVVAAGAIVMRYYCAGVAVGRKPDASPVTCADEETEAFLLAGLREHFPGVPVIAEELVAHGVVPPCGDAFILVDPLDGTKEFLSANGEFTVNIALIETGAPRVGAVYAPAIGRLWMAGTRAFVCDVAPGAPLPPVEARHEITARLPPADGLTVLESRSHPEPRIENYLKGLPVAERRKAGSSLKFCQLAEGLADIYPRFGPTMEWDTGAGDAILRVAGGLVVDAQNRPLTYGRQTAGFHNPDFVAVGKRSA